MAVCVAVMNEKEIIDKSRRRTNQEVGDDPLNSKILKVERFRGDLRQSGRPPIRKRGQKRRQGDSGRSKSQNKPRTVEWRWSGIRSTIRTPPKKIASPGAAGDFGPSMSARPAVLVHCGAEGAAKRQPCREAEMPIPSALSKRQEITWDAQGDATVPPLHQARPLILRHRTVCSSSSPPALQQPRPCVGGELVQNRSPGACCDIR